MFFQRALVRKPVKLDTARRLYRQHRLLRTLLFPVQHLRARNYRKKRALQKTVVENLKTVLAADPLVSVEEFQGEFLIDRRSDIFERLVLDGLYEPDLVRYCTQYFQADKDVIDIGANVGFYTVMFGKNMRSGRVLAVEPTRNALDRLRKNIVLNRVDDKVIIFEGAVSDRAGTTTIRVVPGKEEYSSLGAMAHKAILGEQYAIEEVISLTIDELVARHDLRPGFIKVDVEGGEYLVFSGASGVLSAWRPVILSELSDVLLSRNGSSSKEVIQLIRQHDYDVLDARNPRGPLEVQSYGDIICFPKETGFAREIQAAVSWNS